jgi:hypothetical protein
MKDDITPAQLQRWMDHNNVRYLFTDESRLECYQAAGLVPWTLEECMQRLRALRVSAVQDRSCDRVVAFFEKMKEYRAQPENLDVATIALREENAQRIFRCWYTHFHAWYETFLESLKTKTRKEITPDDYAF